MSYEVAINLAPADPLGTRYATASARGRTYIAWQSAAGKTGVQIVHTYFGVKRYRQVLKVPRGLRWVPIREVWSETR